MRTKRSATAIRCRHRPCRNIHNTLASGGDRALGGQINRQGIGQAGQQRGALGGHQSLEARTKLIRIRCPLGRGGHRMVAIAEFGQGSPVPAGKPHKGRSDATRPADHSGTDPRVQALGIGTPAFGDGSFKVLGKGKLPIGKAADKSCGRRRRSVASGPLAVSIGGKPMRSVIVATGATMAASATFGAEGRDDMGQARAQPGQHCHEDMIVTDGQVRGVNLTGVWRLPKCQARRGRSPRT